MIPEFPNFKPLELGDHRDVQAFTSRYLPYSDFNFVSLWSWNLSGTIALSRLYQNLVVQFSDYITGEPFFSFIGSDFVNDTCERLLEYARDHNFPTDLHLLPEEVVQLLEGNVFRISESRDHFDYVYRLSDLRDYGGGRYKKKRNEVVRFTKTVPHAMVKCLPLQDPTVAADVMGLFKRWQQIKVDKQKDASSNDILAMLRLLQCVETFDFVTVGVYLENRLIAVMVNELVDHEYAVVHMMKADTSIAAGVYAFLMQRNAEVLVARGAKFFNFEQDLGLKELRDAKTFFRHAHFLKKYTVSYQDH